MYVPIHQVPTQVCSAVDERHTRRHEDIKITQRRHTPRHEEKPAVPRRKQYDETRDGTTGRHGTNATKTTDNDSKNNFRSEEVFPEYRFCPRSDAILISGSLVVGRSPRGLLVSLRPFSWPTLVPRSSFRLPCVVRRSSGLAVGRRDGKKRGFGA